MTHQSFSLSSFTEEMIANFEVVSFIHLFTARTVKTPFLTLYHKIHPYMIFHWLYNFTFCILSVIRLLCVPSGRSPASSCTEEPPGHFYRVQVPYTWHSLPFHSSISLLLHEYYSVLEIRPPSLSNIG